ncbi:hypothetical protein [Streptococcus mutans]|uniref:hypothetical protein n=1 Tax=Streptococcus mutans TaxID=1309 RepID=UPI0018983FC7|nr:hypothetical protein [Streptococcus mutans]MCB4948462.1 hypothetical protein [Streptococcus mutans]MCB4960333.1 hypothetical protein [Streptococcus mutans]MCB5001501.1 hypothetical protein [Streptococcus mutans]MCB5078145.1 hypothetical protein [Streptococcus mutans]MCB5127832.1 hypothetical protein [Streptococcus mutans]
MLYCTANYMNIILGEEKDMSRKKSRKLKLLRLLTAQLIAICLLIMVLTQAIFKSPLLVQVCFLIITLCTAGLNYYFIKEAREANAQEGSAATVTSQVIFTVVFLLLMVLSGYKAIQVSEFASKIIFSAAAVISFIVSLLLLWGIRYVKKNQLF